MWPWGHVAVAYILYSLYSRGRFRRPPRPEPALAVLVGSQFPDIIDKPLAWVGVLPGGRTLAHSLLFATALIVVVYTAAFALDRVETATAFVIGHLSHLLADVPMRAFLGYPHATEFLLWPFFAPSTFAFETRVFEPPALLEWAVTPLTDSSTFYQFQFFLFGVALVLWYVDGCPGNQYIRSQPRTHRVSDDR